MVPYDVQEDKPDTVYEDYKEEVPYTYRRGCGGTIGRWTGKKCDAIGWKTVTKNRAVVKNKKVTVTKHRPEQRLKFSEEDIMDKARKVISDQINSPD